VHAVATEGAPLGAVDIGDPPSETLAGSWLGLRFGVFLDRGFIYLSVKIDRRDLGTNVRVRKSSVKKNADPRSCMYKHA
jgi:hypothetical protein